MNSGPQVPQVAGAAANRLSLEDPEHLSRQVAELFFKHVEVPRPFHLEQTGVGRQVLPKPGNNNDDDDDDDDNNNNNKNNNNNNNNQGGMSPTSATWSSSRPSWATWS
ncbi:unnamed protein product, partial [Polarella glacialis]